MLIGSFKNSLGEKNRIAFPKKFKDELGNNLIVTKGYENCLIIVDQSKFQMLLDSFKDIPFVNSNIRDTKRFLVGSAEEVELDKQGRFVVSSELKKFANLKSESIFLGLVDWVELWDYEVWSEKEEDLNKNSESISSKLSEIIQKRESK
ncbi:MAG: division/cell wall cluster transcriptional repressor MraZ [bacterium]